MIFEVIEQSTGQVLDWYVEEEYAIQVAKDYKAFGFAVMVVGREGEGEDKFKVKERY